MKILLDLCGRPAAFQRPSWWALPLRLIVGYGFMEHGYAGLAVLIGALVPLVSVPMTIVLIVAVLTVHLPNGFSSIKLLAVTPAGVQFGQPGYETDLLYLACLAALVLGGSGPLRPRLGPPQPIV
jgi:putative oxidoreductase